MARAGSCSERSRFRRAPTGWRCSSIRRKMASMLRVGAAPVSPKFFDRAGLRVPGEEAGELAAAARRARVNCVIGCNELDDRPGSLTLYNTLVFVGRDGGLLGRHRKLMPTHSERVYWGMGDASDIRVFDMDIGRGGGLLCYAH